jgi:hypothetical protein
MGVSLVVKDVARPPLPGRLGVVKKDQDHAAVTNVDLARVADPLVVAAMNVLQNLRNAIPPSVVMPLPWLLCRLHPPRKCLLVRIQKLS